MERATSTVALAKVLRCAPFVFKEVTCPSHRLVILKGEAVMLQGSRILKIERATVLPLNPPLFSGWNSGRVDLNDLPNSCKVTPTMLRNSGRLDLNFSTLLTTGLAAVIMKYGPKASAGICEILSLRKISKHVAVCNFSSNRPELVKPIHHV